MKKQLIATALIFSLALGPKPAAALIIDAPTLAAKISEWAGKLADASTQITTHVSQAKQMTSRASIRKNFSDWLKNMRPKTVKNWFRKK